MLKIVTIILLSCVLGLFSINSVSATEDFRFSINSLSEFEVDQFPFVSGTAVTLNNIPVSDVKIKVNFPSGIIETVTNSTGQFLVTSPSFADIGEYDITVNARKDNKFVNITITYQIVKSQPIIELEVTNPILESPNVIDGDVEIDPFSKMIKQLEEQKTIEEKKQVIAKEQQIIHEQRLVAQIDLQNDLESSKKQHEFNNPRNAFLRFLADVDNSAKKIFWQQFLFAEKIVKHAQNAKEDALDEGKSTFEATKIFQKEASITQKEIMEFNKDLSIKYGKATNGTQNQFDENGKISRNE